MISIIKKYFEKLSDRQIEQFGKLQELYEEWNQKINVISRKDIEHLTERHVLHSLSIAKFVSFNPGTKILDLGTGGGFPGIPLAILFPECEFHLVDGTKKKILVVQEITNALKLINVKPEHVRAEELKSKYDFVTARAVTSFERLLPWAAGRISNQQQNAIPNGLLALKGGDLTDELKWIGSNYYHEQVPIQKYFPNDHFQEKYLIYIQI